MTTLTPAEVVRVEALETARWQVLKDQSDAGSNHYHGTPENRLADNILGAFGEFGAAKFYGFPKPMDTNPDKYEQDIGDRTDVKSIRSPEHTLVVPVGKLFPERLYMLALIEWPYPTDRGVRVWLQGFRLGAWILDRKTQFWRPKGIRPKPGEEPRPCWQVEQSELLAVDGLTADLL